LVDDGLYRNQWDELFENSKEIIYKKLLMLDATSPVGLYQHIKIE
jgi:hypothetical protein